MIVDVDTHFEPGPAWLDDYPALAARLPDRFSVAESTVRAQVGDLLAMVPADERPPMDQLLPPGIAAILGEVAVEGYGFEGSAMHTPGDAKERLDWMNRVGIDVANTICLEGADYASTCYGPSTLQRWGKTGEVTPSKAALDPSAACRLWTMSEELSGVTMNI